MSTREVYIIFCEAERKRWYMKFLKQGFSHCYLIEPYADRMIVLDYGHGEAVMSIVNNYEKPLDSSIMIKTRVTKSRKRVFFATCVSVIKFYIGLRGLAFTPYQLYKRLNHGNT